MSEVKKIATRESYGNALAELGDEFPNLEGAKVYLIGDFPIEDADIFTED